MLRQALLLLALLVPTVLAAPTSPGPWAGTVEQGDVNAHYFQNVPSGFACPVFPWGQARAYVVTLTYAPPTDTLVLHYGGQSIVGRAGVAAYAYDGNSCQAGWFRVEGRSVTATAAYVVQVTQGGPTRGWLPDLCDQVCLA
jgi:hypothetical protein